jgi:LytS/YehU family sensor histidine kinase
VAFSVGNAFWGYACTVNEQGHWHHTESLAMGIGYLIFPIFSFFAIVLMAIFAKRSAKVSRVAFVMYTIFPVAGVILDYTVHGLSLTYVGLTVSILVIYTSIYLKKQKLIESQRNALMLSQINPHFIYNTLSTIASMCDVSPTQAKHLTIDFSRYLRQNLSTLSTEGLIPFEQELEHVECYLKIEKARFREKLNVIYSIQCKNFSLPPLTVQPLVENAVKHGITKKASGGTLRILTLEEDDCYIVRIIDDGVGFDTEKAEMHVGLQNVRSRLAATCRGDLNVKSTVGIGTRVTIAIPKKKGQ